MTEMSEDRWRLMFTEISSQVLTWHSGLVGTQTARTSARIDNRFKKGFIELCTDRSKNAEFYVPTVSRKTFSFRSVFCSWCTSHKEASLNFTIYNIDLRLISTHCFDPFVKQSMCFCQGLLLWAPFKSCRDHLIMQFVVYLS